jgi:ubiquinone/menaquinone biosynthesis C-methylase UbiE
VRDKTPARILWAVDQLNPRPGDHILEIGCGPGLAAALICERIGSGHLVAIDRSQTAIESARRRNQAHEASGKATFLHTPLDELHLRGHGFDKILAVNVNILWRQPTKELEVIKRLSKPGARPCFVFQPPSAAQTRRIAEAGTRFLGEHGFSNMEVTKRGAMISIQASA